jgi:uncharacterized membrane protein YhaH (DUF805 family)
MKKLPSRPTIAELWRLDGTVGRAEYLGLGTLLFVIKFGIDSCVSWFVFHKPWSAIDYFIPGQALDVVSNSPALRAYYATMVTTALPFIWCGVALTLRRLRAANLPAWLVKLFFFPLVNICLFFVLSVLPNRSEEETLTRKLTAAPERAGDKISQQKEAPPAKLPQFAQAPTAEQLQEDDERSRAIFGLGTASSSRQSGLLAKILPAGLLREDRLGSGLLAILLPQPFVYLLVFLGTTVLKTYGWGLFVGIPFCLGMSSVVLYGRKQPRKLFESIVVSWFALAGLSGLIFVHGMEGAICLLMAAPIGLTIASMGAVLGWAVQRRQTIPGETTLIRLSILLFLPFLMGAEYAVAPAAPLFAVRSRVVIDAPPAVVWHNVVSFSRLPEPREPLFKAGIAYPVRAVIYGRGVGAVRHCIFSTGPFVEPITVWDEPRLLKFNVSAQPQPMFEWSFYKNVDPPHLDGFLTSRQGQFLLTALPDGGTQLEGTTWYQHHMWPAGYWRIWSDAIIHQIHLRVLNHIKSLCEQG